MNGLGERNSPGAFGASGTSDTHAIRSSCSLYIMRVCSLAAATVLHWQAAFGAAAFKFGRSAADDAASGLVFE